MTLENAISNLSMELQKKFPEYSLSIEKNLTIYRKGSNGKVICWGNIFESERQQFEKRHIFMYFVGATSFELYVIIAAKNGEKIKRRIGILKSSFNSEGIIFSFSTQEFKSLRRFLKSAFRVQPKNKFSKLLQMQVSTSYQFSITEWFVHNSIEIPHEMPAVASKFKNIPTTFDVYEIVFSNGEKHTCSEQNLKNAMEYMTKKNLSIVQNRKMHKYEWL